MKNFIRKLNNQVSHHGVSGPTAAEAEDAITRYLKAHPDAETGTVVAKNANSTLDVAISHGDGSSNYPETVMKQVPCLSLVIFNSAKIRSAVQIGYVKGNRQLPFVLGLISVTTGNTTVIDNRPPEPEYLRPGLPLCGEQWVTFAHDDYRRHATGIVGAEGNTISWRPDPTAEAHFPLAVSNICGPPRVYGNRIFLLVGGGSETNPQIASKFILDDEEVNVMLPQREGEPAVDQVGNPYRLRICHMNISQGSLDGASGLPGNGNPADFIQNLHLYDIILEDAPGITWGAQEEALNVLPVDMYLNKYTQRGLILTGEGPEFEAYLEQLKPEIQEERVWVNAIWVAPDIQTHGEGERPGRKWTHQRGQAPSYLQDAGAGTGRFFISRHLVNFRRTYTDLTVQLEFLGEITNPPHHFDLHPLYRQPSYTEVLNGGGSETNQPWYSYNGNWVPWDECPDIYHTIDLPCGFTKWTKELPYAPITLTNVGELPMFTEGTIPSDILIVIGALGSQETDESLTDVGIHKLYATLVQASDGEILSSTALDLDVPSIPWDGYDTGSVKFLNNRPDGDTGIIPWFSGAKYGDEYKNSFGLIHDGGYLESFIFHRDGDDIYAIPKWSYSPQLPCWKFTNGGTPSRAWNIQGWANHPTDYKVYTTCGVYNTAAPGDPPNYQVLVHFEEYGFGTATNFWGRLQDWVDFVGYEMGLTFVPGVPNEEGYFTPYEWPRGSYDYAWEIADWNWSEYGGDTDESELASVMNWPGTYWTGREDEDGWVQQSSTKAGKTHKHGFMLINPASGALISQDYVKDKAGSGVYNSGPLLYDWYKSVLIPAETDPHDVADAHGWASDPYRGEVPPEGIGGAATNFGCVPPLTTGFDEVFSKSWTIRKYPEYSGDPPTINWSGPLEFMYHRASPSFLMSGPGSTIIGSDGWVLDINGGFIPVWNEELQGWVPGSKRGQFEDAITWRRWIYVMRFYTATTTFNFEWSEEIPFSPTRCAQLGEVACFLMQQKQWEIAP